MKPHTVIKHGVFSRLKITYYIVSFFHIENFSNLQFLEKMQKLADCQNASQIANCEQLIRILHYLANFYKLWMTNAFHWHGIAEKQKWFMYKYFGVILSVVASSYPICLKLIKVKST